MAAAEERSLPKGLLLGGILLLGALGAFAASQWQGSKEKTRVQAEREAAETELKTIAESFAADLVTISQQVKTDLLLNRLTARGVLWAGHIQGNEVTSWIASPKAPQHSGVDAPFATGLLSRFAPEGASEEFQGIAMIRIRKDPFRPGEWLAIRSPQKTELAILDAAESFPPRLQPGGLSRAYLISSEGNVLSHSLKGYAGSDFSRQSVFAQGARFALEGGIRHGRYAAIDGAVVDASFIRLETLPVIVALEKTAVIDTSGANSVFAAIRSVWIGLKRSSELLIPILAGLFGLWLAVWASLRAWAFWKGRSRTTVMSAEDAVPSVFDAPVEMHPEREIETLLESLSTPEAEPPLTRPAGLMLEPMPRRQLAVSEGKRRTEPLPPSTIEPLADSAKLEEELKRALHEPDRSHFSRQNRDILISRFEQDLDHVEDPFDALDRLAQLAYELTGSATLLFQYQPHLYRVTLESMAGVEGDVAAHGMSFPISSDLLLKAGEARKKDQILSVADHVPLATLMLRRFRTANYCAWAIPSSGQNPMDGVLVMLEPNERLRDSAIALSRAFRATSRHHFGHEGKPQL